MIGTNNTLKAWMVAALAAILAAALLALAVLAEPAQAATRTVTKTFAKASAMQIPIGSPEASSGPASPYPSEIGVGLRKARVLDVNLALKNVSHTFLNDLDVLLVGPGGQNAIVMSDVGGAGEGVSNVNLTLDDEATNPLDPDTAPASGRYQPTNPDDGTADPFPTPAPTPSGGSALSVFDATAPKGTWKLYVVDDQDGDVGEFAGGWALTIKAKVRS